MKSGYAHPWSLALSTGTAAAGLVAVITSDAIVARFLEVAIQFDEEGEVSNRDWLHRPVYTIGGILLFYGALRFAFERTAGISLERWLVDGGPGWPHRLAVAASALVGIPLLFAMFAYAVIDPAFFRRHYGEDRFFENATALLLVGAGFGFLYGAARLLRSTNRLRAAAMFCLSLTGFSALFLGLEEISYGQRVFGWSTPEPVRETNLQSETNIHNRWTHEAQGNLIWAASIVILAASVVSAMLRRFWRNGFAALLPDQSLILYAVAILALSSHAGFHEPLEQVVALAAFLYAVQVVLFVRTQCEPDARMGAEDGSGR